MSPPGHARVDFVFKRQSSVFAGFEHEVPFGGDNPPSRLFLERDPPLPRLREDILDRKVYLPPTCRIGLYTYRLYR